MDLGQFIELLEETSHNAEWEIVNGSIRSSQGTDGFPSDTITFVANAVFLGRVNWTPAGFIDAAIALRLNPKIAVEIAEANDGRGDPWIREQLLNAVGLLSVLRN